MRDTQVERGEGDCGEKRKLEVSIQVDGTNIITVPQRELFSKNNWPAEEPILEALNKFKAEGKDGLPTAEEDDEPSLDDMFLQG